MKKKLAVYAGTFDPPTLGHLWVIERAADSYELIVAIGVNPRKAKPMFSVEERLEMLKKSTAHLKNIRFDSYPDEYLVHYAQSVGARFIVRGIRSENDYKYEREFGDFNRKINPKITTVTLMPPPGIADVSSSATKELIGPKGWEEVIKNYVPEPVLEKLKQTHRINSLRQEWFALWECLGAKGSASEALDKLIACYAEPHRHYHNLLHVEYCLAELKESRHLSLNLNALKMAIWFHDAVYEIKKDSNNEGKSAEFAAAALKNAGLSEEFINIIRKLILATTHTAPLTDLDEKLIADIDLSSLGIEEEKFDEDGRNIRKEFGDVPEDAFKTGRAKLLKSLLEREAIYYTRFFHDKYEAKARENIARAIAQLSK